MGVMSLRGDGVLIQVPAGVLHSSISQDLLWARGGTGQVERTNPQVWTPGTPSLYSSGLHLPLSTEVSPPLSPQLDYTRLGVGAPASSLAALWELGDRRGFVR